MTVSPTSQPDEAIGGALYSVVYSSNATQSFDDAGLEALLAQSRSANHLNHITGMLMYRRNRFIQFLEGPEGAVRELVARIAQDARHTNVRVMLDGYPSSRQFTEWTMGYEPVREPQGAAPEGFRDTFDDFENAADADAVLRATRELSMWFRVRASRRES